MLSPLDLQGKRITTKRKKYDKAEMDEYLDFVFENYKALYDEHLETQKRLKEADEKIAYYRSIESTMQKALVLAEKTSTETKEAAILKAEAIEKDANTKASKIVSAAEAEYDKIRDKCLTLMNQFNQYKLQLKQVTTAQLEYISGDSFDIHEPEIPETPEIVKEAAAAVSASATEPETAEPETMESTAITEPETTEPEILEETITPPVEELPEEKPEISASVDKSNNTAQAESVPAEEESATLEQVKDSYEVISDDEQPVPELKLDEAASGETIVLPNIKEKLKEPASTKTDDETVDILTADTIDLSTPITKVKQATEQLEPEAEKKEEQLEPVTEKKDVPTLDSLLNSMNMSKKKKGKKGQDEDPFEFLGSVDDF
ncbi:MAG: DivIVA domain-containing protein [Eubacterium sp.]|nr:DivIVA domain-containing protein [Eubacterium sp.]